MDYTLTVAVSIAAGTAALTSAFPGLSPATVPICLAALAVITLVNLRRLGDAARAFLLPDRLRYRFLHNHTDLVLTRALRYRPDVVVARVPVRVRVRGRAAPLRTPVSRSGAQAKASRGRYQPGGCARP